MSNESNFGTFTDPRDGQTYKTVKIGKQVWLAQNLNFDMDGKGSYCYDDNPENAKKYGRLYEWEAAKKACPPGWHLPDDKEWDELEKFVKENNEGEGAGTSLKTATGWKDDSDTPTGTDKFGFSALPAGFRSSGGYFSNAGSRADFWSASESSGYNARYWCYWYLRYNFSDLRVYVSREYIAFSVRRNFAFSVRCVKDSD